MNLTTTHNKILFFYKGTALPLSFPKGEYRQVLQKIEDEVHSMIENELRAGNSLKDLASTYRKQLDAMEQKMLEVTTKGKEFTIDEHFLESTFPNMSASKTVALWSINILALIKLKELPDDEMNGYMIIENNHLEEEEFYQTFEVKCEEETKYINVIAEKDEDDNLDSWSYDLYIAICESLNVSMDMVNLVGKNKYGAKRTPIDKDDNVLLSSQGISSKTTLILAMVQRLRGGTGGPSSPNSDDISDENDVKMSAKAIELCKMITQSNYEVLDICRNLRNELEIIGILPDTATYATVKGNTAFCRALLGYVALGLNKTPQTSRYGCGIVSDYDLYHRLDKDAPFNDFCTDTAKIKLNTPEYDQLKKNRANVRRFIGRVRDQTILNFELPETPDVRETRSVQKSEKEIEQKVLKKLAQSKIDDDDQQVSKKKKPVDKDIEKKYFSTEAVESNGLDSEDDCGLKTEKKHLGRRSNNSKEYKTSLDVYESDPVVIDYLLGEL